MQPKPKPKFKTLTCTAHETIWGNITPTNSSLWNLSRNFPSQSGPTLPSRRVNYSQLSFLYFRWQMKYETSSECIQGMTTYLWRQAGWILFGFCTFHNGGKLKQIEGWLMTLNTQRKSFHAWRQISKNVSVYPERKYMDIKKCFIYFLLVWFQKEKHPASWLCVCVSPLNKIIFMSINRKHTRTETVKCLLSSLCICKVTIWLRHEVFSVWW